MCWRLLTLALVAVHGARAAYVFGALKTLRLPCTTPARPAPILYVQVFVAPLHKLDVLVCCDEAYNHYLVRDGNVLCRCVWAAPVAHTEKCRIFAAARAWYEDAALQPLTGALLEGDDASAWARSHDAL